MLQGTTQRVWGQLTPYTDDSLLPTPRKRKKDLYSPFALPTNPFRTEGQEGKALILQISQPHCMASGRPPPRSPGLRMKAEIQPFSPKDKSPRVRGQGLGALDRHGAGRRNLQFYHHGKYPVSSMQFRSFLLSTYKLWGSALPPLLVPNKHY